jgi:hypothetical protein
MQACAECKSFWSHLIELLGERVKWKLVLVSLEIMLIKTQNRCTVCTKHAIGSETVLGAPGGTPR